jgi:hypothetical protein
MRMVERQTVAVGGQPEPLWDFVLGLVRPSPRVLWVGTASAEDPSFSLVIHDQFADRAQAR